MENDRITEKHRRHHAQEEVEVETMNDRASHD